MNTNDDILGYVAEGFNYGLCLIWLATFLTGRM